MKRRTLLISGTAVVVLGTAVAALVVALGTGPYPSSQSTGAMGGTGASAQPGAEANFLGATAAHLCNAQSSVFDDPKALAEAFNATPDYPGLSAATVTELRNRLTTDPDFTARLTRQLQVSCKPGASTAP